MQTGTKKTPDRFQNYFCPAAANDIVHHAYAWIVKEPNMQPKFLYCRAIDDPANDRGWNIIAEVWERDVLGGWGISSSTMHPEFEDTADGYVLAESMPGTAASLPYQVFREVVNEHDTNYLIALAIARSLAMSNENKNTNVKEETTWTNFKFFNNQVKLKVIEKDDRQMYLADCRFMPGSVANGIDLGDQNGISGHMTVFLTEKQYFKAAEQKANGEQINVGLPSTQLKDGKIEVNFYNHESKEVRTIPVNPFAASKANKAAREAFFERKDAEREQGKSLGAKAASARGASEKLDGQSQAAPAKDNLVH